VCDRAHKFLSVDIASSISVEKIAGSRCYPCTLKASSISSLSNGPSQSPPFTDLRCAPMLPHPDSVGCCLTSAPGLTTEAGPRCWSVGMPKAMRILSLTTAIRSNSVVSRAMVFPEGVRTKICDSGGGNSGVFAGAHASHLVVFSQPHQRTTDLVSEGNKTCPLYRDSSTEHLCFSVIAFGGFFVVKRHTVRSHEHSFEK